MTTPASTDTSVSPDSGEKWHAEGVSEVSEGIYRIPLPLPMDGLRAVNVYVVESEAGLTLVDGGWAIPQARELLERCLGEVGHRFADIRRFLVTHMHRDHYTMARALGAEFGAEVLLGRGEKPALDAVEKADEHTENPFAHALHACGAHAVADLWARFGKNERFDPDQWGPPTGWLEGDHTIALGSRDVRAVETPGHTPGHYVFVEEGAGLLFAGDHVLPTITPSIGFTYPLPTQPLRDFLGSLAKVRALPDLQVLPAHGPVGASSHERVDALLAHHEERLAASLAAVRAGATTPADVAGRLTWTRHERTWAELDPFNQGMAAMETRAHLDLLVARGELTRALDGVEVHYAPAEAQPQTS